VGRRERDDWIGEKVELYAGTIRFKNEDQPAVLVRPLPRAAGEKKVKPKPTKDGPSSDINDVIPY
jgi:hypothetical protein